MPEKLTKDSVYTVCQNNQCGFTFLSLLLAMILLAMMLPFISYAYKAVDIPMHDEDLSIQQFFMFLQHEIRMSEQVDVHPSSLYLQQKGVTGYIIIKQHQDVIHRQVSGRGHEIFLRDVRHVQFHEKDYGILVEVTTLEGEIYEKIIAFYE